MVELLDPQTTEIRLDYHEAGPEPVLLTVLQRVHLEVVLVLQVLQVLQHLIQELEEKNWTFNEV